MEDPEGSSYHRPGAPELVPRRGRWLQDVLTAFRVADTAGKIKP